MNADITSKRARIVADDLAKRLQGKPPELVLRRKLSTLVADAGYQRTSPAFLNELAAALVATGIHSDYAPNDSSPTSSSWLRLSLAPFAPTPLLFRSEKDLESFIVQGLGAPGMFHDLELIGRQYRIGNHVIDILAKERVHRGGKPRHVVIEVKRNADEAVVLQTLRYLDALSTRDPDTPVRAIIVTGPGGAAHSSTFADHVTSRYEIGWLTYEVTFNLAVRHIGTDHVEALTDRRTPAAT